jgi:hypothetical protein
MPQTEVSDTGTSLWNLGTIDEPIPLHGDHKGAINLAENPVTGHRSKHINIRHHMICKYIKEGKISMVCMPTTEMVADGFTNLLLHALLQHFNLDMGLDDA